MRLGIDINLASRLVLMFVITVVVGYLFYFMISYSDKNEAQQTGRIKEIIQNALMQCYALEGSYPSDVTYLTRYGVVFDEGKYIYYYSAEMGNIMPDVRIIEK